MLLLLASLAHAVDPTAAERVAIATRVFQQLRAQQAAGTTSLEDVYRWSVRLMEAERDAGVLDAERSHAARMRDLAMAVADQVGRGSQPAIAVDIARFYEAEAGKLADTTSSARPPMPAPLPQPLPQPLAAPGPAKGSLETCFQACDAEYATCAQDAEHFRLGMGTLQPEAACDEKAAAKCGTGRSGTAAECRATESRACQAAQKATACSRAQTQCSARCR
jgi:hypothetical protein